MNKTSDWIKVFFISAFITLPLLITNQCEAYFSILFISFLACIIGKILFGIIDFIDKSLS